MIYVAIALSCNNGLQQLDISKNNFQAFGIIIIVKALQNISTIQKLCISNNNITDEAADDIATAIYSNTQLQEFYVSKNNLRSAGAIKIAKTLQNLTKLYINDNHITDEAADDIATALSCNADQLQELDISNNWFRGKGIMVIAKALQNIVTLMLFVHLNLCYSYWTCWSIDVPPSIG